MKADARLTSMRTEIRQLKLGIGKLFYCFLFFDEVGTVLIKLAILPFFVFRVFCLFESEIAILVVVAPSHRLLVLVAFANWYVASSATIFKSADK